VPLPILLGLLLFTFWAIYDVVTSETSQVRNLPKVLWVAVVVLLFGLGPVLWLLFGRPTGPIRSSTTSHPHAQRRARRAPEAQPDADVRTQRVVTDRRSAELDRMLEEWERTRRGEDAPEA
jgi:hypothetical protein